MKADFFLKLDTVTGESEDFNHKGAIEISTLNWEINQKTNMHSGNGGATGRSSVGDLIITKKLDCSSPVLHTFCCQGMPIISAQIIKRKSGSKPLEYFRMTLKDVLISAIQIHLGEGESPDVETIHLSFSEFTEEYIPQNNIGSGLATVKHGYNLTKRKKI